MSASSDDMRNRAETTAESRRGSRREEFAGDVERLLHELEIHEVELEMQNDELRRAQQDLQASRDEYFELFDMAPVGYLVLGSDQRIEHANFAACRLLSTERARLVGGTLEPYLSPADAHRVARMRERLYADASARDGRLELSVGANAVVVDCRLHTLASRDATPRLLVVLVDVTEQALRKRALREQTARLQAILDTAADGVILLDDDARIESFNRAAEEIFGYRPDEVIGRGVDILTPPDNVDDYTAFYVSEGPDTQLGPRREITGRRKDGREFPLELAVSVVQDGGRQITWMVRDLTERKRMERELGRAQKMEAIGRLASGVAHDFNNLLMGMSGCADIALRQLDAGSPARMYLEEIRDAAFGGESITRQLLTFARGRGEEEAQTLEIDRAIDELRTILRRLIREDIEIRFALDAPSCWVSVRAGQIEQWLLNLAANARDAMPEGGTLTIETSSVEVPRGGSIPLAAGTYAVIDVRDTGRGMDEQTLEYAFEPFYTTKEVGEGTGLGLSTVYATVQQAGGHIEVTSELDRGTTFRIYLPLAESSTPPEIEPPSTAEARGGTVLVAEDEALVRMAVRYYLESAGYRVLEARTGDEAVQCCERFAAEVDLLVTDIVLPGMGGREIAQKVGVLKPGVKVLYMSAHPTEELVRAGRIEPDAESLQKPFTREALLEQVNRLLLA